MSEHHKPYWHNRGYLPHYETDEKIQSVTMRLADSLPKHVITRLLIDKDPETDAQYRTRIEWYLDQGLGSCILRSESYAKALQDSLLKCDGERYELHSWVIMPNHVHLLVKMFEGYTIGKEVKAWKAAVSRLVSDRSRGRGGVWQEDYWDRFIRDEEHYINCFRYIDNNPVKAGLVKVGSDWQWGSCRLSV